MVQVFPLGYGWPFLKLANTRKGLYIFLSIITCYQNKYRIQMSPEASKLKFTLWILLINVHIGIP